MTRWIFVTGGVLSGLGKGLVSASVSKLLQRRNLEITPIKCDGYLNVDPGTMNPHEHGEVFVLKDGTEVDMDFGHYERFLGIEGKGECNLTSGKIFQSVIDKEREGEYLGKTVQMVPHVTNEIKSEWRSAAEGSDIAIVEIGGTVGDIENMLYLEAVRQLRNELGEDESYLIHTTLVPFLDTTGEQKTKPTQHSVKALRETGLAPDMIVGRSEQWLEEKSVEKIALFCDVKEEAVISDPTVDTEYRIPLIFEQQNVDSIISDKMDLPGIEEDLDDWKRRVENLAEGEKIARIAICGKYMGMDDSYASVEEALKHAAADLGGNVEIEYVDTEEFEPSTLQEIDGVIIPGGFGERAVEGKIDAIKYCRRNDIPLLGLCYGLQLMVIETARNQCGIDATSEEWDRSGTDVIAEMPEQKDIDRKGGTMRLGSFTADLEGQVRDIYGRDEASERHRHRYEVDPAFHSQLEEEGMKITGKTQGGKLAEYIEIPEKKFFIGTQAHPEFNSSLQEPNPLYKAFLRSSRDV